MYHIFKDMFSIQDQNYSSILRYCGLFSVSYKLWSVATSFENVLSLV